MTKDGRERIKKLGCGTLYYCLKASKGPGITTEGYYLKVSKVYLGPYKSPEDLKEALL